MQPATGMDALNAVPAANSGDTSSTNLSSKRLPGIRTAMPSTLCPTRIWLTTGRMRRFGERKGAKNERTDDRPQRLVGGVRQV